MVHTVTLQVLHLKVRQEFVHGGLLGEDPVFEFESKEARSEVAFKHRFASTLKQHLLRREVSKELVNIVGRSLCRKELACRYVEKRHSARRLAEMHSRKEVIFLVVKHVVAHRHTRCDKFGDTSLHEFLRQFRIFELVADSHTSACTYKFRQISIESMMRKTRHCRVVLPFRPSCASLG